MTPLSAGLLVHAQRALAVATSGSTHAVEEQLQRVSMQVSCKIILVDRCTYLFFSVWAGRRIILVGWHTSCSFSIRVDVDTVSLMVNFVFLRIPGKPW